MVSGIFTVGSGFDHGFHYTGEIIIIGTSGIFGIEFHIIGEVPGPFHTLYGTFQDIFTGGVEFRFNMEIGSADPGMDPAPGGMPEGFGGHFNIFLYSAAESADRRIFDGPGDLIHRIQNHQERRSGSRLQ